jgi:FkbM family methyltransferase
MAGALGLYDPTRPPPPNRYDGCRYGTLECPPDAFIGRALEVYGEYSQFEADFLCSLLKSGDVVLEAGAHVGTLTVAMAKAVGFKGKILAYEPQPEIFEALEANTAGRGVRCVRAALSSRSGTLRFSPNDFNTGGVEFGPEGEREATAATIDGLSLKTLHLLKIDVEGMEWDVLTGGRETIQRLRPVIYCENDRAEKSRALFDLLFEFGYRVWRHEPPLFNPANHRGQPTNLWPGVVSMNLVALPEESRVPPHVEGLTEVKPRQWAGMARFGGLGDDLIAAAVLPDLVRQGNLVEVITNAHAGCVFEHNPWVSKLSICEDGDQPGDGGLEWQKWFDRRSHEYQGRLFHLSHTIETTLALVPAQTAFWWPAGVRRRLCNKSYLEMSAEVAGTCFDFGPLFYASRAEKAKAAETKAKMGERVIGWVICGSRIDKVYPYSAMAIARLIRELDTPVMMVGSPGKDFEIAKQIQVDVIKHNGDDKGLHLAMSADAQNPNWPIRRSLAQAQACDLLIGPDTGIMWGVAMEPMPKIMLLSHASAENITKYWHNTVTLQADQRRVPCAPCHRLQDSIETCRPNADNTGVACISDVSVETIIQQARSALA